MWPASQIHLSSTTQLISMIWILIPPMVGEEERKSHSWTSKSQHAFTVGFTVGIHQPPKSERIFVGTDLQNTLGKNLEALQGASKTCRIIMKRGPEVLARVCVPFFIHWATMPRTLIPKHSHDRCGCPPSSSASSWTRGCQFWLNGQIKQNLQLKVAYPKPNSF